MFATYAYRGAWMSSLRSLLGKEATALFASPIAYVVIAVFLLLLGYTFTAFLFLNKTATLVHIFFQAAVLFLLIVPVLTMRQFAEERKTGTLELLLTASLVALGLPISALTTNQIVAATVALGLFLGLW